MLTMIQRSTLIPTLRLTRNLMLIQKLTLTRTQRLILTLKPTLKSKLTPKQRLTDFQILRCSTMLTMIQRSRLIQT